MPQSLHVDFSNKGGNTQVQVYRNNNGSLIAVGNPYTPTQLFADGIDRAKQNLACQFGQYFYCSAGRDLRRYNPSTQDWDLEVGSYTFESRVAGLYLGRGPTGAGRLMIVYGNSLSAPTVRTLDSPGGVWSAGQVVGPVLAGADWPRTGGSKVNNTLYLTGIGQQIAVNIASLSTSLQVLSPNGNIWQTHMVTRVGTRLFAIAYDVNGATGWMNLYERLNGVWTEVIDGSVNEVMPRQGNNVNGLMFYDEASASLIVQVWQYVTVAAAIGTPGVGSGDTNPGGDGLYSVQIPVATLVENNITGATIPGGIQAPGGPSSGDDARAVIEVDTETDPTTPVQYPWWCVNDGSWQRYLWNGVAATMTPLGSGGDRGIAPVHNPTGGGEYFYDGSSTASPALHIEEVADRIPIDQGMRLTVTGFLIDETGGAPTPVDKPVGLYYGTVGPTAKSLGTISNPVKVSGPGSTPTITTNKMTMTFDNASIYTFDWRSGSGGDGLPDQTQHLAMLHITP